MSKVSSFIVVNNIVFNSKTFWSHGIVFSCKTLKHRNTKHVFFWCVSKFYNGVCIIDQLTPCYKILGYELELGDDLVCNMGYIRLITRVSVKYDEICHEQRQYCHEPKASGNTKYE